MSDRRMAQASLVAAMVASCALGSAPLLAQDLTAFCRRLDAAYAEAATKRVADSLSNLALRQAPGDSARIGPVSLVVHGSTPFSASAIASQAAALIGASPLAPLAPDDRSYHLRSALNANRIQSRTEGLENGRAIQTAAGDAADARCGAPASGRRARPPIIINDRIRRSNSLPHRAGL